MQFRIAEMGIAYQAHGPTLDLPLDSQHRHFVAEHDVPDTMVHVYPEPFAGEFRGEQVFCMDVSMGYTGTCRILRDAGGRWMFESIDLNHRTLVG
ncbi:MAG: hypothetical protein ACTSPX_06130, partial [Candidatus Thorarchaeota archaeon]